MRLSINQRGLVPVLAVIFIVTVLLAGVILFYLNKPKELVTTSIVNKPQPLTLSLDSPTSQTEALDDNVLVKGKTLPNIRVVLFNDSDEEVLQSDPNGIFSGRLQLSQGTNTLTITAFSDDGEEKTVNLDINYNPKS